MPPKLVFSEEVMVACEKRYANGESMRDIAVFLGCGKGTIRLRFIERNVEVNKGRSISNKKKGRPSPRLGTKCSEESKRKMSEARKGVAVTTGYRFSEESKRKMSESRIRYFNENPDARERFVAMSKAASLANRLPIEEKMARDKVRRRMKHMLRRTLILSGRLRTSRTESALGYSRQELRKHIENQFSDGMSWTDRGSFHIDHIVPIRVFIDHGITDPSIINSLDNLQILSPYQNQKKSGSYDPNSYQGVLFERLTAEIAA